MEIADLSWNEVTSKRFNHPLFFFLCIALNVSAPNMTIAVDGPFIHSSSFTEEH